MLSGFPTPRCFPVPSPTLISSLGVRHVLVWRLVSLLVKCHPHRRDTPSATLAAASPATD
ncbi:hypothetical protein E2C01_013494 [Portunus trituberculatus]|uniref:Uncharacterized protein n=1 Tax=Portunus trituberculatus TaxID=210409 RepID=A0A5B7DHE9_PORTR|nr:hypothetical protein [Portunus trituberculatus]